MIIDTVGFQLPLQMPFIYDDNVIQTLSAYGPDNSLCPQSEKSRKSTRTGFLVGTAIFFPGGSERICAAYR